MDTITRREFGARVAGLAALGGIALPRALGALGAARRGDIFEWREVTPRVHVALGGGGNSLVAFERAGPVLVADSKIMGFGGALRREAEARAGRRVTHLVSTHHHFDHTGGNTAFTGDVALAAQANGRARVLASAADAIERVRKHGEKWVDALLADVRGWTPVRDEGAARAELLRLVSDAGALSPERFAPATTFDREHAISAAGQTVEAHYVSPGHTDNDAFLYLPRENVLHAGDLLFNGFHPFVDVSAGASTSGWQRCVAAMTKRCNARTVVIPGHGPLTDRTGLEAQSRYFDRLREVVGAAMREGRTRDEIKALKPAGLASLGFPEQLPDNLGIVYDEMKQG
ncbi:MAG TPA: MBL fold metallo-hydrolase [Gemmatimonadaceae bacterium]|nr:MBL fold metallo-hydrolase [Gemmatimonadaceae bacterium]